MYYHLKGHIFSININIFYISPHYRQSMHKGLTIPSSMTKYQKTLLLCPNLSDITIRFISTKFKAVGCLEA